MKAVTLLINDNDFLDYSFTTDTIAFDELKKNDYKKNHETNHHEMPASSPKIGVGTNINERHQCRN